MRRIADQGRPPHNRAGRNLARCTAGIEARFSAYGFFHDKYGFSLDALCGDSINKLLQKGYLERSDGKLVLTHEGMVQGDYSGKFMARALLEQYAL